MKYLFLLFCSAQGETGETAHAESPKFQQVGPLPLIPVDINASNAPSPAMSAHLNMVAPPRLGTYPGVQPGVPRLTYNNNLPLTQNMNIAPPFISPQLPYNALQPSAYKAGLRPGYGGVSQAPLYNAVQSPVYSAVAENAGLNENDAQAAGVGRLFHPSSFLPPYHRPYSYHHGHHNHGFLQAEDPVLLQDPAMQSRKSLMAYLNPELMNSANLDFPMMMSVGPYYAAYDPVIANSQAYGFLSTDELQPVKKEIPHSQIGSETYEYASKELKKGVSDIF